jgi:hypothetical protein
VLTRRRERCLEDLTSSQGIDVPKLQGKAEELRILITTLQTLKEGRMPFEENL